MRLVCVYTWCTCACLEKGPPSGRGPRLLSPPPRRDIGWVPDVGWAGMGAGHAGRPRRVPAFWG